MASVGSSIQTDRRLIRVAAFTGGRAVPSARFRLRQHIGHLSSRGIVVDEYFPRLGAYPPASSARRLPWAIGTLAERVPPLLQSHRYDASLLQREFVSTLPTLEGLCKAPRIVDVDDAIWLPRNGIAARWLARISSAVICGNATIAEWFKQYARAVHIVPTAVDCTRFRPTGKEKDWERPLIVWSGVSSGHPYLESVIPALRAFITGRSSVRLRVISDYMPRAVVEAIPDVEFVPWSEDIEASALRTANIGIMPLFDDPWARGKCAFKLLCYMASGLPVVASPVGMNKELFAQGNIGFAPTSADEWYDALDDLIQDPLAAERMGAIGRSIVESTYSPAVIVERLAGIVTDVVGEAQTVREER